MIVDEKMEMLRRNNMMLIWLSMCSMKCNIMLILLKICHDCSTLYHNQDHVQDNNDGSLPKHMDLIRDPVSSMHFLQGNQWSCAKLA